MVTLTYLLTSSLETALGVVAAHPINIVVAGRTDTGVHATEQVAHFDSAARRSERAWIMGGNSNLDKDVTILWAKPVEPSFHARFSAVSRQYRYLIWNTPHRPAIFNSSVTWHYRPLDVARMQAAADFLVGEHDFTSYRALGCQARSPTRMMKRLQVTRRGNLVIIDVIANAFLHHMVRNIAGVLMDIGAGEHEPHWAQEVLLARDRTLGGITAPPYGLYLVKVDYPEVYALPRRESSDSPELVITHLL